MENTKYSVLVAVDEKLLLENLVEKIHACAPDLRWWEKLLPGRRPVKWLPVSTRIC